MAIRRARLDGLSRMAVPECQEARRRQIRMQGRIPATAVDLHKAGKDLWGDRVAATEFLATVCRRRATGPPRRHIARPHKATGEVIWVAGPRMPTRVHTADSDTVRLEAIRARLAAGTHRASVVAIQADSSHSAVGTRQALAADTPEVSAGGATRPVASGGATAAVAGTRQGADTRVAEALTLTEGIERAGPGLISNARCQASFQPSMPMAQQDFVAISAALRNADSKCPNAAK